MARSPNCTGAPLFKGRVDVTITYPDPDETLLETPVALPTSEPAEAQISYTLASRHMPVWSPFELEHVKTAALYTGGENNSGAARTVYYRILKNGVNVATGSGSVSINDWYLFSHFQLLDVQLGDVLSCKLWANSSGCNWNFKAVAVAPTRIGPADTVVWDIAWDIQTYPMLRGTAGAPDLPKPMHLEKALGNITGNARYALMLPLKLYRLFRSGFGDVSLNSVLYTSLLTQPTHIACRVPTRIAYTPLNLRVCGEVDG